MVIGGIIIQIIIVNQCEIGVQFIIKGRYFLCLGFVVVVWC